MSGIVILMALVLAYPASAAAIARDSQIKIRCPATIVVDQSGRGNFTTIQSAIDAVPPYNNNWVCIRIQQGLYKERVYIRYSKSFIYMVGAGMRRTNVVSDGHDPVDTTATIITQGQNIIVESMSFTNSYNYPPTGSTNPIKPAAAAKIEGDNSAFYNVGFYGFQDTLWDFGGRHYFKGCWIEGAVDFIFGRGQSMYEDCVITVVASALRGGAGYITAQAREHPNDTSGFVFKFCVITGNGNAYLGRPWRQYARVIFHKTYMSNVVLPLGWDAYFNSGGSEGKLTFKEVNCRGPGSNTAGRAKWVDKMHLSKPELKHLLSHSYINHGNLLLWN